MKKNLFVTFLMLSVAVAAAAATAEHGSGAEHQQIPYKDILWQAINLGILLIAIVILIKDSVKKAFINRRQHFMDQAEKTKQSLLEAEKSLADIKAKLSLLESGEQSSVNRATTEAGALKASLIKDTETQAIKLKEDAQLSLAAELEKAKLEVGQAILVGATAATTRKISDEKAKITQQSEAEFLRQLGQVRA